MPWVFVADPSRPNIGTMVFQENAEPATSGQTNRTTTTARPAPNEPSRQEEIERRYQALLRKLETPTLSIQHAAQRRLMRDLQELSDEQLPGVWALPRNDNLFEWHANLLATAETPYAGHVLHVKLVFPQTYPRAPPKVTLLTRIPHPNVFGDWICLDVLEEGEWSTESNKMKPYTGWSSAYSVLSLLVQLQSFFCEKDRISASHYLTEEDGKKSLASIVCECGHSPKDGKYWPPIDKDVQEKEKKERERMLTKGLLKQTGPQKSMSAFWHHDDEKQQAKDKAAKDRALAAAIKHRETEVQKALQSQSAPAVTQSAKTILSSTLSSSVVTQDISPLILAYLKDLASVSLSQQPQRDGAISYSKSFFSITSSSADTSPLPHLYSFAHSDSYLSTPPAAWKKAPAPGSSRPAPVPLSAGNNLSFIGNFKNWNIIKVSLRRDMKLLSPTFLQSGDVERSWKQIDSHVDPFEALLPLKASQLHLAPIPISPQSFEKGEKIRIDLYLFPEHAKYFVFSGQQQSQSSVVSLHFEVELCKLKESQLSANSELNRNQISPNNKLFTDLTSEWALFGSLTPPNIQSNSQNEGIGVIIRMMNNREGKAFISGVDLFSRSTHTPQQTKSSASNVQQNSSTLFSNSRRQSSLLNDASFSSAMNLTHQTGRQLWISKQINHKPQNNHSSDQELGTLSVFPFEILFQIFSYLSKAELARYAKVSSGFRQYCLDSRFWLKGELFCYFCKASFVQEILGVGINLQFYPGSNMISNISSPLDLLSESCWSVRNVRVSAWKETFTHWLPLYISPVHGERAFPLCERMIASMCTGSETAQFAPHMAVKILTSLMNTMVVDIMSGDLWGSMKAIEGYFCFHHLLLKFLQRYPSHLQSIENDIENFISNEDARSKKNIPIMGEFLPLITVTDKYRWTDIGLPMLTEIFDRNQKWAIKQYPELERVSYEPTIDKERLRKTFEANQVSLKLILFHVYFLEAIAKPAGSSVQTVCDVYDSCYGRPSQQQKDDLQFAIKRIQSTPSWLEFFKQVHVGLIPTPASLTKWLRDSVQNSARKRYHMRAGGGGGRDRRRDHDE